eukprot:1032831-Amphidinium_carterae.1
MPANGTSLCTRGGLTRCFLPATNSAAELRFMRAHLSHKHQHEDIDGELEGVLLDVRSVAMMCFIVETWTRSQCSVETALEAVNTKLRDEWIADLCPVLKSMPQQDRLYIRELAAGTATESPHDRLRSTASMDFLKGFFDHYVIPDASSGTFKLTASIFTTCLMEYMTPEGELELELRLP